MYQHIDEFLRDWKTESEKTSQIFNVMTDDSLSQAVAPGGRSVGRLAWHITTSILEMMGRVGLQVDGPEAESAVPDAAEEIQASYASASASLHEQILSQWTDASLFVEHDMYGMNWSNVMTLNVLIRHEIHHRAQLTVLLRQAGIVIPGIYGPAREQWAAMGRDPQL